MRKYCLAVLFWVAMLGTVSAEQSRRRTPPQSEHRVWVWVTNQQDQPVVNTRVVLERRRGNEMDGSARTVQRFLGRTNRKGYATFRGLPSGRYLLSVSRNRRARYVVALRAECAETFSIMVEGMYPALTIQRDCW
jgi:hypothetical protein